MAHRPASWIALGRHGLSPEPATAPLDPVSGGRGMSCGNSPSALNSAHRSTGIGRNHQLDVLRDMLGPAGAGNDRRHGRVDLGFTVTPYYLPKSNMEVYT